VVPGAIAQFSGSAVASQWAEKVAPGTWAYYLLTAILIIFFTYFYTSIIFNPVDIAENLKKQGGFIPGVKPGAKTAEYIDDVVSKITLPGAIFLTIIALHAVLGVVINKDGTAAALYSWTAYAIVIACVLFVRRPMSSFPRDPGYGKRPATSALRRRGVRP